MRVLKTMIAVGLMVGACTAMATPQWVQLTGLKGGDAMFIDVDSVVKSPNGRWIEYWTKMTFVKPTVPGENGGRGLKAKYKMSCDDRMEQMVSAILYKDVDFKVVITSSNDADPAYAIPPGSTKDTLREALCK